MGDTRPPVSYPSNEELRTEIERLRGDRDLWKMRAEQAQAILREFNREQRTVT